MDWKERAYHLAVSFTGPNSPKFLFVGYTKDAVYIVPLATTLPELVSSIITEATSVTPHFLSKVWTELECKNICRATGVALIELMWHCEYKNLDI
jgi:hypothetical protein